MTLKEISRLLNASVINDSTDIEMDIQSACSADMMSTVMYYHSANSLLITSLTQPSVIRTAEMAGIKAIVFVLNKKPDANLIELAGLKNIPLLSTPFCMYTASGTLFEAGMPSCFGK
ncbi:DRTGG domain protein [bacterium BMS3Abin09]|nr:DRTGG domain protein [bacterium BMS3Abin09]GBE40863.1 DRTGG domain protein [bacterium BMS3Bbin09]